ncbi:hypothetical protein L873DRAFT_1665547 [Choiromyces venosus 120613-1]|uniref:PHD-type domain-containing protein n=1 Tax=Choiromyces venosus 120613-1 TaxID=1336337 RepID=A0A3N4KFV0_9PEZI|nr:hypothetical protein L873DRAFT_1665547 [Choiromyces venosus 120613-1]
MAPSPSVQTPTVRGRGRGRPRLRGRGSSILSSRTRPPSASNESRTPTGRRRPTYQNGYRPGGAGGGGRYMNPTTGEVVTANEWNTARGGPVIRPRRTPARAPATPAAPASISGADIKPREERSYTEFHIDLDLNRPLRIYPAEEIDGERPAKFMDVQEKSGLPQDDQGNGSMYNAGVPILSGSWPPTVDNGVFSTGGDIDMEDANISGPFEKHLQPLPMIAIDPALAALTPPPPPSNTSTDIPSIPTDPALVEVTHGAPQTPAVTPTEELASASSQKLNSQFTPSFSGPSRGGKDGQTLASLRAHRSTTGRPTRKSYAPPSAGRGSRMKTNIQDPPDSSKPELKKPEYRKITPFQFSEAAWLTPVGSTGPQGLNNPPNRSGSSVDSAMIAIGYQETSRFERPRTLIRDRADTLIDDQLQSIEVVEKVEYDMDEQDNKWLTTYNSHRRMRDVQPITREMFEVAMTKIEKEWVTLERRIPKAVVKPHGSTYGHRRRSSGNDGDEDGGEDSKCVICDDGECENSNAIVFCDGCNLAVHQECYGVPHIPEGQWLCRKCIAIPNKTANCIFCPNTDGAFKQTTNNKWAHLLCAIWIPEVILGNTSYMEPVDGMDLVPKSRWKLSCYICKQKMGACIQCSNKSCFIAFHVTCGRRARLSMKMKNSLGTGALMETSALKAYCDKHVPEQWRRDNDVDAAVADAMDFYTNTMTGAQWGDSQSAAMAGPDHGLRNGILRNGNLPRVTLTFGNKRRRSQDPKSTWKLASGAPVIPRVIYDLVVKFISRFDVAEIEEFVAGACKYWTLKRESRRGASLVKSLQASINSFTSAEVVKKKYSSGGFDQGTIDLEKRREFAQDRVDELDSLRKIFEQKQGTQSKSTETTDFMEAYTDLNYFPEIPLIRNVLETARSLDPNYVFISGFSQIQERIEHRLYPNVGAFACDLLSVLKSPPSQPILGYRVPRHYQTGSSIVLSSPKDDLQGTTVASLVLHHVLPLLENMRMSELEIRTRPPSIKTSGSNTVDMKPIDNYGSMNGEIHQLIEGNNALDPQIQLQDSSVVLPPLYIDPELGVHWDNGRPPWYLKDLAPVGLRVEAEVWSPPSEVYDDEGDLNGNSARATSSAPTLETHLSLSMSGWGQTVTQPSIEENITSFQMPNRGRRVKPIPKPERDSCENDRLLDGFRAVDLPSPLRTIDENATPDRDYTLPSISNRMGIPGPPPNLPAVLTEASTQNGTSSALSSRPQYPSIAVDSPRVGESSGTQSVVGMNGTVEPSPATSAPTTSAPTTGPTTGRKSRKGMIFPRQSNGRFGTTKGAAGASGAKKARKKKW